MYQVAPRTPHRAGFLQARDPAFSCPGCSGVPSMFAEYERRVPHEAQRQQSLVVRIDGTSDPTHGGWRGGTYAIKRFAIGPRETVAAAPLAMPAWSEDASVQHCRWDRHGIPTTPLAEPGIVPPLVRISSIVCCCAGTWSGLCWNSSNQE
jgi:hypothetical protein